MNNQHSVIEHTLLHYILKSVCRNLNNCGILHGNVRKQSAFDRINGSGDHT